MKLWLKDKVAVVTGSGRGIGKEIALRFSKEGAKVVVNDVDQQVAEEVVNLIKTSGGEAVSCIEPVNTMAGGEKIIGTAISNFGKIDILVNNAGIIRDRMFVNMTEEEWDAVISVHLKGHFCCTKAAVNFMKEKNWGRIINITSTAGLKGNQGQANYSAAKAGIVGFTLTLAMELKRYNITVNAIAPGAKTRMTASIPEDVIRKKAQDDPRWLSLLELPGPEYIAPIVVYLASDEASDITGKIIRAKGNLLSLWKPPEEVKLVYTQDMWSIEDIHKKIREDFELR